MYLKYILLYSWLKCTSINYKEKHVIPTGYNS